MSTETAAAAEADSDREDTASAPKPPPAAGEDALDQLLAGGTRTSVGGNVVGSFLFGEVGGNVNIAMRPPPRFVAHRTSPEELRAVRCAFVEPEGYRTAEQILREHHVVVLFTRGSGRFFAAQRLLVDLGADPIAEIHPDRAPRTITDDDLEQGTGYIWDGSQSRDRPLGDRDLGNCGRLLGRAGCWLVIVLDRHEQIPESPTSRAVALTAPPPVDVATAAIRFEGPPHSDEALAVLTNKLAPALATGDPPRKAALAAALAMRVESGSCPLADALRELSDDVRTAVARWFEGSSVLGYATALALAVALLEDQPYDEVVDAAMALDLALRTAETLTTFEPWPRRLFATSRQQALEAIGARVVLRDHPEHPGLHEETVKFERQDWARTVLLHVWQAYAAAQLVFRDWMCSPVMLRRYPDET